MVNELGQKDEKKDADKKDADKKESASALPNTKLTRLFM